MRRKKGALQLSITAIVVLIIAIVVLGLAIGFIRKQFTKGTELVAGEMAGIKQRMKEDIRAGGELLVFTVPDEVSVGKPAPMVVGVRNTAANPDEDKDRVCFRLEVTCIKPFTIGGSCTRYPEETNVVVGGWDIENDMPTQNSWFKSLLSEFDLRNYEGDVWDAIMLVRGVKPDSYAMEFNVYIDTSYETCADKTGEWELYASKTFTLNVV